MSDCYTHPTLLWDIERRIWVLQQDVCYVWNGIFIEVPKGFRTDLATIPWPLVGIPGAARYGNHNRATVLHDWVYKLGGYLGYGVRMTRAEADRMFLDVMKEDGVGWQRFPMFWAVRAYPGNWGRFS